jgi:hypothetical protein
MAQIRLYETGATRGSNQGKLNYTGFLSPIVLRRYAEFMQSNQMQADGQLRDADNWKKGIPRQDYLESLHRHFMSVWLLMDRQKAFDETGKPVELENEICAMMFNSMGLLHEMLKDRFAEERAEERKDD